jgi:hypothetical protein
MSSVKPIPAACDRNPEYTQYRQTERWRKLRIAVFMRAKEKCEICRRSAARELAHLTYEHFFNEPMTDMLALCVKCHRELDSRWKTEQQQQPERPGRMREVAFTSEEVEAVGSGP